MSDTLTIQKKREEEKETFAQMLAIYCHGNHKTKKGQLCDECTKLKEYAEKRTNHCPYMATKTFCTACTTPCYTSAHREQVRVVMKYAGPRMLFHSPKKAIQHMKIVMQNRRIKNAH